MDQIQSKMVILDTDSPMIKKAKYTGLATKDMLGLSAALDPIYKNLAWMTEEDREDVFKKLRKEDVSVATKLGGAPPLNLNIKMEPDDKFTPPTTPSASSPPDFPTLPAFPSFPEAALPTLPAASEIQRPEEEEDDFFDDVILVKVDEGPVDVGQKIKLELDHYRAEPRLKMSSHPMDWWQRHMACYPYLTKVAIHYLCIPVTIVPSESVFSMAGNIVTKRKGAVSIMKMSIS